MRYDLKEDVNKAQLSWKDVGIRAFDMEKKARRLWPGRTKAIKVFPVPRGGIYAALLLEAVGNLSDEPSFEVVESIGEADMIVDDIVDSGITRNRLVSGFAEPMPFLALVDKTGDDKDIGWVVFPWERMAPESDTGPEENIRRLLQFIGEDPHREGLKETPDRVMRSYAEIFGGYKQDAKDVIKCFEDDTCDEMVIVKDIEFYSVCEHHMQPFFGSAHIAYIPDGKVLGVSKLARVLDVFARRLQIQERLCEQVTGALEEHLKPKGVACVLEASHFCMMCRGVGKQHSKMITSSLRGVFRDAAVRQEFFNLIRK